MKILRPILIAAVALLAAAPLRAQQPTFTDSLADRLVGRWVLRGTIGGEATTHDVTAEWALAHQYVHIHEVSREKTPEGAPQYEAHVYVGWDPRTNQYVAAWLDVFGGISPQSFGRATRVGDSMPFVFLGPDGTPAFNNTFAYDRRADSWEWRMDNVRNGALEPFARVTLSRQ